MRRTELELRDVRNFLAIAKALHFGRAASQLGISQPVLSKQIKHLETLAGCRLFDRTAEGAKLTLAGEHFRMRVEPLQKGLQDALRSTLRIGKGEQGSLHVGVCSSVMFTAFSKLVERFREQHPDVSLEIRELSSKQQVEQLRNGLLDLGFVRDGSPSEGIRLKRLCSETLIVVLPQGHHLSQRETLTLKELSGQPLVLFSPARARTMRLFSQKEDLPEIAQEVSHWSSVLSLVRSGLGVAIAPASVAVLQAEGTTTRPLETQRKTAIDVMVAQNARNPAASKFLAMTSRIFLIDAHPRSLGLL